MSNKHKKQKLANIIDDIIHDHALKLNPVDIIRKKRDGNILNREEIEYFILEYNNNRIPDYQMSSLLMTIYMNGMNLQETADLTLAMTKSGHIANLSSIKLKKIDKHSTGGVGDKVSLILAPLIASCNICVPMMSGRGLGHTGGTLDKLESINGFSANIEEKEFINILNHVGCAIIGPTGDIAPADKKIYALRDVTATTESLALVSSSIMSKKIAENPDGLVLDIKTGRGAFLKTWDESVELAKSMIAAGENANISTIGILTNMDEPMGYTVGNWLETYEAIDALHNKGPNDLMTVVYMLAAHMINMAYPNKSIKDALNLAQQKIKSGEAWEKFRQMVKAQGGDLNIIDSPENYPTTKYIKKIYALKTGYIKSIDALEIGLTSVNLGAGRHHKDDILDYNAGIKFHKKVGDQVTKDECIVTYYTNREINVDNKIQESIVIIDEIVIKQPVLQGVVTQEKGVIMWSEYASLHQL